MDDEKHLPLGSKPELILKPVIKELARTQVCFPNLKLLVDRISIVTLPATDNSLANEAYRLYLTDRDRTIQGMSIFDLKLLGISADQTTYGSAVLKRRCQKHVTSFDVREGSYVVLTSYRLARGRRLAGIRSVMSGNPDIRNTPANGTFYRYVIIEDFYSIGEELRDDVDKPKRDLYTELIKTPKHRSLKPTEEQHTSIECRKPYEGDGYRQDWEQRTEVECFSFDSLHNSPESLRGSLSKVRNSTPTGAWTKSSKSSLASPLSQQRKRNLVKLFENIEYGPTRRRILGALEVDKQYKEGQKFPLDSKSESASSRSKHCSREPLTSSMASPNLEERKRKRNEPFGEIDPNANPPVVKITKRAEEISSVPDEISNLLTTLERDRTTSSSFIEVSHDNDADHRKLVAKIKQETLGKHDRAANSEKGGNIQLSVVSPAATAKRPTAPNAYKFKKTKALLPINRLLNICSLDSLTGQNATRNKVHDVFAVICSVDESVVKPPKGMPLKRDIRIMDPSTDKKVLVSVFVDPESFKPAVGTVALFRSLTTHEWDRGMLNVYANVCAGRAWFLMDPVGVEGCDVKRLKEWWERKKSELKP